MLATVVFFVSGCDLGPDYQRPAFNLPKKYRSVPASAKPSWPSQTWWEGFNSPELNHLIRQAQAHNFDIAAAIARVHQADAQIRLAGASLLPSLSANSGAQWQHEGIGAATIGNNTLGGFGSNTSFDLRTYSVGASASYELDFWGRNRATRQSAVESAMYSRFDQQTVALTVVANVANTWLNALSLSDRLTVARENVAAAVSNSAVIRGRASVGTANALDVAQQEALEANERALIPSLESQLEQQLIALGLLVGEPPESVTVTPGTLVKLKFPAINPGVPADLLARRPDVAAAEALLHAQNFNIKVARAAFFPTMSLTSSAGYEAEALNKLINPGSLILSAAAAAGAPIFDGGTLRGQLDLSKGKYDELLADYCKSIVQALTDVDTNMTAWRYAVRQEVLQRRAVDRARTAATIAREQLRAGTVDVTTLLTAETTLFTDEDTLVQVRLTRAQSLINLYKALGGGWSSDHTQSPELQPGMVPGAVALPIGGNMN
jgi:outer membrane protein, multidrug efflux system